MIIDTHVRSRQHSSTIHMSSLRSPPAQYLSFNYLSHWLRLTVAETNAKPRQSNPGRLWHPHRLLLPGPLPTSFIKIIKVHPKCQGQLRFILKPSTSKKKEKVGGCSCHWTSPTHRKIYDLVKLNAPLSLQSSTSILHCKARTKDRVTLSGRILACKTPSLLPPQSDVPVMWRCSL